MPPRLGQDRSPRRRVTQELSSRQILEPFVYASPLNIRDAGEKYECDTVAELRPARKAIAIGFRWGDDLIAAAIRLCGASTGLGETGCPVVVRALADQPSNDFRIRRLIGSPARQRSITSLNLSPSSVSRSVSFDSPTWESTALGRNPAGFRSIKNNIQATIYPGPKMLLILIPRPFTDLLQHNWSSPAILGE